MLDMKKEESFTFTVYLFSDENIQYEDFTLQEPMNGQSLENYFSGISLGENSQCIIINDVQFIDNFNNTFVEQSSNNRGGMLTLF